MKTKFKIWSIFDGSVFTSQWLQNNVAYLIFLVAIALLFIANNYASERVIRKTNRLKSEIQALQAEHIAVFSEVLSLSRQTEIAQKLDTIGIQESTVPPQKIIIPKQR